MNPGELLLRDLVLRLEVFVDGTGFCWPGAPSLCPFAALMFTTRSMPTHILTRSDGNYLPPNCIHAHSLNGTRHV